MKAYLLCLLAALVSASLNTGVVYPGYVVDYSTPKNTLDPAFAFMPISGIDSDTWIDLNIAATVSSDSVYTDPTVSVCWQTLSIPDINTCTPIIVNSNAGSVQYTTNATNNQYYFSLQTSCSGSRCEDTISTELSVLTYYHAQTSNYWPPFQLLNQRRTAKFTVNPLGWLYFWLPVTDDLLQASQRMQLYIGAQFYASGSSSAIQALVYNDAPTWPNSTANVTDTAIYYYPTLATQRNDWVMDGSSSAPPPFELRTGLYQVCFWNPLPSQSAKFTVKVGFNAPPQQTASLNASFNHFGFIALIFICIAYLKH